jgi:hypothetical protein
MVYYFQVFSLILNLVVTYVIFIVLWDFGAVILSPDCTVLIRVEQGCSQTLDNFSFFWNNEIFYNKTKITKSLRHEPAATTTTTTKKSYTDKSQSSEI